MTKKIKVKALKKLVQEKVEQLSESSDFMAQRKIIHRAAEASMDFEKEIVSNLDLIDPNQMPPEAQRIYHQIVTKMGDKIKSAVVDAVIALGHSGLPRESDAKEQPKVTYHESKDK